MKDIELKEQAKHIRENIVKMASNANIGHPDDSVVDRIAKS